MNALKRPFFIIAFGVMSFGCCARTSVDAISISAFEALITDGNNSYKKKEDYRLIQVWIPRLNLEKSGYLSQYAITAYVGFLDTNAGHAKVLISTVKNKNDQQDIESIYLSIYTDGNPTNMWTYSVKKDDFTEFLKWTSSVWE